jgi:hypothetical protein
MMLDCGSAPPPVENADEAAVDDRVGDLRRSSTDCPPQFGMVATTAAAGLEHAEPRREDRNRLARSTTIAGDISLDQQPAMRPLKSGRGRRTGHAR